MGSTLSTAEPDDMRIASRDVCDDETWTNTVMNRSSTSVQERLHMLQVERLAESAFMMYPTEPPPRRLAFAATDMVRVFEKSTYDDDGDSSSEEDEDYEENNPLDKFADDDDDFEENFADVQSLERESSRNRCRNVWADEDDYQCNRGVPPPVHSLVDLTLFDPFDLFSSPQRGS